MEESILALIREINEDAEVTDYDMDLLKSEALDSLGIAQLVAALEDKFDLEIDAEDIVPENFHSVHAIADLVKKTKQVQ